MEIQKFYKYIQSCNFDYYAKTFQLAQNQEKTQRPFTETI